MDASAGAAPAAPPITREQVVSAIIAVAPANAPEPPVQRWSKAQTVTFLIVGSLLGWAAIIALVMALL